MENVVSVARQWIGTPFYPHTAKKGVGADCVNFALAVYQEAGIAPHAIAFPAYNIGGGDHQKTSIVIDWLEACGFMRREPEPKPGFLVTFKVGRVEHHVGVMSGRFTFCHAMQHYGVIECDLRDSTWKKRLRSVWGPIL